MKKIESYLKRDKVELIEFEYNKKTYVLSGWWILEVFKDEGKKDKVSSTIFESKEDFLSAKIFDGKSIREIDDSKIKIFEVYEN